MYFQSTILMGFIHSNATYTMIWNGLDYPAMVFPVTKVDETLDPKPAPRTFLSEADRLNYETCE